MKVLLNFALLALWSALQETATSSRVADEFCLEKERAGHAPGTVFSLSHTCQMCACDGALRKFCTSDPACKKKKQEEYDARHRRPCYRGGSKYAYGSQVQQDCNICTCNNATWICTTEECGYSEEDEKKQVTPEEGHQAASNCEDDDKRCRNWIKKKGKSLCSKNKYVKRKCHSSCETCPKKKEEKKSAVEEEEACQDLNTNCEAWSKRQDLCETHKYMRAKCRRSCNICGKERKETAVTQEDTEEEEEEERGEEETVQESDEEDTDEEETREKTAEELEEERKQQAIDAWRDRLIAEGQLIDTKKTPLGCLFNCGGTVYPWGSALQDAHCGVCTCKRRSRLDYYFSCTNSECETTCT